jgi:uncharacterized lipoprotein YajG
LENARLLAVEKRTLIGAALLLATSTLMLSGCVSDKKTADAAPLAGPVDPALGQKAAASNAAAKPG